MKSSQEAAISRRRGFVVRTVHIGGAENAACFAYPHDDAEGLTQIRVPSLDGQRSALLRVDGVTVGSDRLLVRLGTRQADSFRSRAVRFRLAPVGTAANLVLVPPLLAARPDGTDLRKHLRVPSTGPYRAIASARVEKLVRVQVAVISDCETRLFSRRAAATRR